MNKSFLKIYGFIVFACLYSAAWAQDPNGISLPKITPPGPTSQELQRFLGYSANGSTGTTDVSIPLYTLNLPGLSIPFSLKYNSSGIKVSQSAGIAGYGWTMFPGFKITRTIMGKPDEVFKTNNIGTYYLDSPNDKLINIATPASPSDVSGMDDGQFDIFTIHLPNYNGSFILKWDGTIFSAVSIPDAPLKIVPVLQNTEFIGFTVTDDHGVIYTFQSDKESDLSGNTTAWMLSSIKLPGEHQAVTFTYVNSSISGSIVAPLQTRTVWDRYDMIAGGFTCLQQYFFSGLQTSVSYNTTTAAANEYDVNPAEKSLSSITFPSGRIDLTYQSGSLSTAYLQSFSVADADGNPIRTINFNVSNKVLQSVNVLGEGTYTMQYRPQIGTSIFDQDRWGFFNNKGNVTLIPQMTLTVLETDICNNYPSSMQFTPVPITFPGANREVDTAAMQSNILQKITYPTGGWTSFAYEPHSFVHNGVLSYGGGLRTKEIVTYDPLAHKALTKIYNYGINESGLANLEYYPEDESFIDEKALYAFGNFIDDGVYRCLCSGSNLGSCRRRSISSKSHYRYFGFNTDIWYSQVTEYTSSGGKTVYSYSYTPNDIALLNFNTSATGRFPTNIDLLEKMNSLVYGSPELEKREIYMGTNGSYQLLKSSEYHYTLYHEGNINGMIVNPMSYIMSVSTGQSVTPSNSLWGSQYSGWNYVFNSAWPFMISSYTILTGTRALTSTSDVDYANGQAATVTTSNTYDANYPFNKIAVATTTSDGGTLNENYYYPTSTVIPSLNTTQQSTINMLNSYNRLTTMVEKTTFKNLTIPLKAEIYQYQDWGNNIIAPQYIFTQKGVAGFEPRLQFNAYDNKGNVQSVSQANGPEICYLYGYNGLYPIAKIENTNYAMVQSALGGASQIQSFRDTRFPANGDVGAFLAPVRAIAGAQVTSYTYMPMVGVTSVMDTKGQFNFYDYDSVQRLINIWDQNANLLKHIDYHYKQ